MKLAPPLILLLFACVADVAETEVTQDLRCPSWGCGTNSATVGDGLLFDQLDASGNTENEYGIRIVGAKAIDGTELQLRVERHSLIATSLDGSRLFTEDDLVGTVIRLHHDVYGGYELLIEDVKLQALTFWSGVTESVPAYEIKSRKVGEGTFKQYVCKYDVLSADPVWSGVENHAIVFQGDLYDAKAKTVSETDSADPRFNLACAATAPAKMHLLRHTRAGSYLNNGSIAYDTTVEQRQAMLKMLTADYCGTGQSFTADGMPLVYDDSAHWYNGVEPYSLQESLWDHKGALCLDEPRYAMRAEIDAACGFVLPPCGSFTDPWAPWDSRAHVMSALH